MPEAEKKELRAQARALLRSGKANKHKGESDKAFIDRFVYGTLRKRGHL